MTSQPFPLRRSNPELESEINAKGGIYYVPEGENPIQHLVPIHQRLSRHRDWAEDQLYEKRPCPIEFGFIFSSSFNAFAYTTPPGAIEKFDFIGLNIGTIFTFMNIFGRILSRPDTFPNIGNPELESTNVDPIPYLTTDVYKSDIRFQSPNCPVRGYFASELAQLATEFLFFHELAHLRNGHADFIRNKFSYNHIAEAFDSTNIHNDKLTWQTLENDADCSSLVLCVNLAHIMHRRFADGAKHPDPVIDSAFRHIYGDFRSAVDAIGYVSYIAFRIFDSTEWSWMSQPNLTHPLPLFRMVTIGPLLYEIFKTREALGYQADQFLNDYSQTLARAEIHCGLIQGAEPDTRGISDILQNDKRLEYMKELESRWGEIRPLLEKYVRGGNLAP